MSEYLERLRAEERSVVVRTTAPIRGCKRYLELESYRRGYKYRIPASVAEKHGVNVPTMAYSNTAPGMSTDRPRGRGSSDG